MAKPKKKIGYFSRDYIGRGPINKFGKLGYYPVTEMVKTYDISKFNKGKRIKFEKATDSERKELRKLKLDKVYTKEDLPNSSQAHFRKSVSNYRKKRR